MLQRQSFSNCFLLLPEAKYYSEATEATISVEVQLHVRHVDIGMAPLLLRFPCDDRYRSVTQGRFLRVRRFDSSRIRDEEALPADRSAKPVPNGKMPGNPGDR